MTRINYTATINTMGEATEAEAARYVAALANKLAQAFPGADVSVTRNDRNSSSVLEVDGDVDASEVHAIANNLWGSGDWF